MLGDAVALRVEARARAMLGQWTYTLISDRSSMSHDNVY
jgi:hypothetical protein